MKGKVAFVLGAAVGYVLGTRAGRARYEQIKRTAAGVWESPTVQRGVTAVTDVVNERVDVVKANLVDAGKRAFDGLMNRDAQAAPQTHDVTGGTDSTGGTEPPVSTTDAGGEGKAEQA